MSYWMAQFDALPTRGQFIIVFGLILLASAVTVAWGCMVINGRYGGQ